MYTQFELSSKYSYNKSCTIAYFINLISNRANFAIHGPTSLLCNYQYCIMQSLHLYVVYDRYIYKRINELMH